uniref:XrtA system polysaccharide chain length determinant n=1 Tax=Marinobacterium profundum TaxID=1714300 RepID=UPI00082CBBDA|nr:XrtA system polysaccharide chain length determinant [Marinobacterium profundum]
MQDIIDQVVSYLRGIWIYKWIALLLFWIICLIGWPFVLKMPDQYIAQAKVYVDTQSLLAPLLRGLTIQTNSEQQVQLIVKTLLTRPNLEKITRLADIDIQAENDTEYDAIIAQLVANLKLSRAGRENIYAISYSSHSAEKAKKVVEATLTTLVENTLGNTREDNTTAANFLDRQIAEYEARLNEADNLLKEFKQRNYELMSSDSGFYSRINSLKGQTRAIELDLLEAKTRLGSLEKQLVGEEPNFGIMDEALTPFSYDIVSSYDGRITTLENQLDQLRLKYTDQHPSIRETALILKDLQAKRAQERQERQQALQAVQTTRGDGGLNENPVYQQLKLSHANEETTVRSLEVRLADYQQQLDSLHNNANTIPELEAELQSLQRGYSITQQQYNALLSRRESAHLSEQADASADGIKFRIIEPPRLPTAPTGPNRPLILSGVLAGAVGIGIAVAFLISQLRPVFFNSKQLFQVTGYPVLGVITMIKDKEFLNQKRREIRLFGAIAGSLLAFYGMLIFLQMLPDANQQLLAYVPDLPNTWFRQVQQFADRILNYF